MLNRRQLLGAAAPAALLASPWGRLLAQADAGAAPTSAPPLRPVNDANTGLPLIQLPEGFRYTTIAWTGDPMRGGQTMPDRPDGMAVVRSDGEQLTLVRNHERIGDSGAFGDPALAWDPAATGGTTNLVFDPHAEALVDAWPSLSGTLINCAGGPTPWGSWLSCEECVLDAGEGHRAARGGLARTTQDHGFVFEVGAVGQTRAEPIPAMGRFVHEAVAIEPASGAAYLTEDARPAGLYRFLPDRPGRLSAGGRLQQLAVPGNPDLRRADAVGRQWAVQWVAIDAPDRGKDADGGTQGVQRQGWALGATRFTRLEGCWHAGRGRIVFVATDGGPARLGQVWQLDTVQQTLELLFVSPSRQVLDHPDNVVAHPHGGSLLCEDGRRSGQRLQWLHDDGRLLPFAVNDVALEAGPHGIRGNFRRSEWAGACFSPDGRWLFANIQTPGITLAITGPWADHASSI